MFLLMFLPWFSAAFLRTDSTIFRARGKCLINADSSVRLGKGTVRLALFP